MSRCERLLRAGLLLAGLIGPAAVQGASPAKAVPAKAAADSATPAKAAEEWRWLGVGRAATPAEVRAWDIDVRPDFKGLPKGSGTVARGQDVWESKCASCHGVFGESNQVFTPVIGGTTPADMKSGHVASLIKGADQRSTMMKLAHVSTLWDYINRAMPWTNPRTLSTEEVYAVTAYILNLADVVPTDFTLSDANMAEVQNKLPNRNGLTTSHGMWEVKGKPDVKAVACMKDCIPEPKITSSLPAFARPAHGNLAEQNRLVGPVRGVVTVAQAAPAAAPAAATPGAGMQALANKGACLSCHQVDRKVVGPGFNEIAAKYKGDAKAAELLAGKIKSGSQGVWGAVPMPAAMNLDESEIARLARWIMAGAPE